MTIFPQISVVGRPPVRSPGQPLAGGVASFMDSSYIRPGWLLVCGTSEATPLFAGVIALANRVAGRPLAAMTSARESVRSSLAGSSLNSWRC